MANIAVNYLKIIFYPSKVSHMTVNVAVKKSDMQQIFWLTKTLERRALFAPTEQVLAEKIFVNATNDWPCNSPFMKTHGIKIFILTKVIFEIRTQSEHFETPKSSIKSILAKNRFITIAITVVIKTRDLCHPPIEGLKRFQRSQRIASDDARPSLTYNYHHLMIQN